MNIQTEDQKILEAVKWANETGGIHIHCMFDKKLWTAEFNTVSCTYRHYPTFQDAVLALKNRSQKP